MADSNRSDPGSSSSRRRSERAHRRKERVLHTRVSDTLAEDIRKIADDLRVPTSNLVRNVLEEVFDVVESVSDDMGDLFGEILHEADGVRERLTRQTRSRSARGRDRAAWRAAEEELASAERQSARPGATTPPPPPVEWYFVEAGEARGPVSLSALEDRARRGRLDRNSLVWCVGMDEWRAAGDVAALAQILGPPPVPDTPPA